MSRRHLVWITRAEPGSSATAERVRAIGFEPVVAPLLTVEPVEARLELDRVAALAVTSANGVRAFAERSDRRDFPIFAVGDATAEAARDAGFEPVRSADGDVGALAALIRSEPPGGIVLCPGAEQRAGDLVTALTAAGIEARAATLYRTVATTAGVDVSVLTAVLLHSPRAATVLAERAPDLSDLHVVGLSPACLAPLAGLKMKSASAAVRPREDALMDALIKSVGA